MPDIKQVLNDEIRRLARKELKNVITPLSQQLSEHKRLISALKKEIAALEKRIPAAVEKVPVQPVNVSEESKKLRLSPKGIAKLRSKFGLSQSDLALLVGVSTHTVSMWEIGKVSPRLNAKTAICALRGIGKKELKKRLSALQKNAENSETE